MPGESSNIHINPGATGGIQPAAPNQANSNQIAHTQSYLAPHPGPATIAAVGDLALQRPQTTTTFAHLPAECAAHVIKHVEDRDSREAVRLTNKWLRRVMNSASKQVTISKPEDWAALTNSRLFPMGAPPRKLIVKGQEFTDDHIRRALSNTPRLLPSSIMELDFSQCPNVSFAVLAELPERFRESAVRNHVNAPRQGHLRDWFIRTIPQLQRLENGLKQEALHQVASTYWDNLTAEDFDMLSDSAESQPDSAANLDDLDLELNDHETAQEATDAVTNYLAGRRTCSNPTRGIELLGLTQCLNDLSIILKDRQNFQAEPVDQSRLTALFDVIRNEAETLPPKYSDPVKRNLRTLVDILPEPDRTEDRRNL